MMGSYYEFMGNLDFDVRIAPWLTFSSVNNYKYVHSTGHGYEDPRSMVERASKVVSPSTMVR